jgi:hypothetical protein
VFNLTSVNLDTEQMRITWVACFLTSVVLKYFHDRAVFSMEPLVIEIISIWNIDSNPISNLKPSHCPVLLLLSPVSYGWYRECTKYRNPLYNTLFWAIVEPANPIDD